MKGKRLLIIGILCILVLAGFTFAGEGTIQYEYNAEGELDKIQTPVGQTVSEYQYDDCGNMVEAKEYAIQMKYENSSHVLTTGTRAEFQIIHDTNETYTYGLQVSTDRKNWSMVGSMRSSKDFSTTRSTNGTVYFRGIAEEGATRKYSLPVKVEFYIPLKLNSMTTTKIDESTIKLSASAAGKDVEYKFSRKNDDDTWTVLRNYNSSNQYMYTYTGTTNKTETYKVEVKDSMSSAVQSLTRQRSYVVEPRITVGDQTGDYTMFTGGSARIHVSNSTNHSGYTYQFEKSSNNSNWNTLKSYSSSTALSYSESTPQTNWVRVRARKDGRTYVSNSIKVIFVDELILHSFTKTVVGPENKIKLTANAGGMGLSYDFYESIDNGTWNKVETNTTGSYTFTHTEGYSSVSKYKVIVKDRLLNSVTSNILTHTFSMTPLSFTSLSVKTDSSAESYIAVTAYGDGPSFADFHCKVQTGSGSYLRGTTLTPGSTWRYYPSSSGRLNVTVTASDGMNSISKSGSAYITKPILPFVLNDIYQLTYNAGTGRAKVVVQYDNGMSPTFSFYYKKAGTYSYSRIRGYSSSNYTYWTPPEGGTYHIRVLAKDDNNSTPKEYIESIYFQGPSGSGGDDGGITQPGFPGGGGDLAF